MEGQILNKLSAIVDSIKNQTFSVTNFLEEFVIINEKIIALQATIKAWQTEFDQTGILAGGFVTATQMSNALAAAINGLITNSQVNTLLQPYLRQDNAAATYSTIAALNNLINNFTTGNFNIAVATNSNPNAVTANFAVPITNITSGFTTLYVKSTLANTAQTVTFLPNPAVGLIPTYPIFKWASWNTGQHLVALDLGDIPGPDYWMHLMWDVANSVWVLLNPATNRAPASTIIDVMASSAPIGYLAIPYTQTFISLTVYPALNAAMAALGYPCGAPSAGANQFKFGMPYMLQGYSTIHSATSIGSLTIGSIPSHSHAYSTPLQFGYGVQQYVSGNAASIVSQTGSTGTGTDTLAAGLQVLKCVKY